MKQYTLHTGDNREVLKTFDDNSIDSIVTDPPYELGFMGKKWDSTGIAYNVALWAECLRVLKPGGHLLAFGGSRTYHRMAVAIEDAGFEVRDCIMWIYGSGFPKGLNISKQIDKMLDATPEIISTVEGKKSTGSGVYNWNKEEQGTHKPEYHITKPSSELAKQWDGWNTALKPAHEPIVMARKPLECSNVAENVMKWNVGGINVDGCRVGQRESEQFTGAKKAGTFAGELQDSHSEMYEKSSVPLPDGRWPANIVLDEEAAQMLDEQSGWSKGSGKEKRLSRTRQGWMHTNAHHNAREANAPDDYGDSGGASRFFYVAKASKAEREVGLEGMAYQKVESDFRSGGMGNPRLPENFASPRANHHPTVKPIALMRYLVRMVTPNNGMVLDPFMGSGTTGCASMLEGVRFIGIELNEEYLDIAERRIRYWLSTNMAKE